MQIPNVIAFAPFSTTFAPARPLTYISFRCWTPDEFKVVRLPAMLTCLLDLLCKTNSLQLQCMIAVVSCDPVVIMSLPSSDHLQSYDVIVGCTFVMCL